MQATNATTLPPPDTARLPDDPATLKRMIAELVRTLTAMRGDNEQLRQRLDLLLRRLYGPRAERYHPNQQLLFADLLQQPDPAPEPPLEPPPQTERSANEPKRRPGHGRQTLPKHLRREQVEHKLTGAELLCPTCGEERCAIGSTVSSQLDYQPASLFVVDHVCHAYACPHCQGAAERAAKPPPPIEGGLPGPGLLAYLVTSKYLDHLPLYRLERIFARQDVHLSRSTLCDWMAECATMLRPLYDGMTRRVLQALVLHSDDTRVPVLDPTREHAKSGHLWIYIGDWLNPYNVFDYAPDRTQQWPQNFLKTFTGFLQADAYTGYDRIYRNQGVVEVACNAHARRKFHEARTSSVEAAHVALAYYRQLYDVEDQIRRAEAEHRARGFRDQVEAALFRTWWEEQIALYRQEYAAPIWHHFHTWLVAQKAQALPKSPLGEAVAYTLNQYVALTRYVHSGFLNIDNNWAEREMKRVAIGRKNWMFAGNDAAASNAAVLYSFTSTCQRHGIDPFVYLRDVFRRLPTHPPDQLEELLPDRWRPPPLASPTPTGPATPASPPNVPGP